MMKVIIFTVNGRPTDRDIRTKLEFHAQGHTAYFSNGNVKSGFQDSCDAVYLSGDFPHVEAWATKAGIEVMKPEIKKDAKTQDEKEPQAKEEVKPAPKRRGRKPANSEPESEG